MYTRRRVFNAKAAQAKSKTRPGSKQKMSKHFNMNLWTVVAFTVIMLHAVCASPLSRGSNEVVKPEPNPKEKKQVQNLEAIYYQMYAEMSNTGTAKYGRKGNATNTTSCTHIRSVPAELRQSRNMRPNGISRFYQKYTEAYGVPVLASHNVPDRALKRACYVLRFLLADRSEIRNAYYKNYGRVAIIGVNEKMTSIPEYRFLKKPDNKHNNWNEGTRGVGAIPVAPVSTGGAENILCYGNDTYRSEDILIREIAQGIHYLAAKHVLKGFDKELTKRYIEAISSGKWANSYARLTVDSYFGEGVQSYFNVNGYATPPNGVHNEINTRSKLSYYDPGLYNIVRGLFPCGNSYIKRCDRRQREQYQVLGMDCR